MNLNRNIKPKDQKRTKNLTGIRDVTRCIDLKSIVSDNNENAVNIIFCKVFLHDFCTNYFWSNFVWSSFCFLKIVTK